MTLDAQSIARSAVDEVAALGRDQTIELDMPVSDVGDFCRIWPRAKPVLEFLAGIAAFIPGAGVVAAGVLKALIKVGDQVAEQIC